MKKFVNYLKKLKKYDAVAIKQSLEDEGASFDQLKIMRKITMKAGLQHNIKVGGCEAKTDIFFCEKLGVSGIVAPMVETGYALRKFLQIISKNKKQKLYINLESIQALKNIKDILRAKEFKNLTGVIIGRSDLAGSLNLEKSEVDSKKIYNLVFKLLKKLKKKKIITKMGGSLTPRSLEFVKKLYKNKLLDRVETRNVEIRLNNQVLENFKEIIIKVFHFELEWIKFNHKREMKSKDKIKNDSLARIKELKKRITNFANE
jgi:4-hydroxy-2-oxoheptanedioate aldolase